LAPSVCGFLFVYEISREPLNGFAPNSHGRRVWSLAQTSLKVKVKGQWSRSPGTITAFFGPFGSLRAVYVYVCLRAVKTMIDGAKKRTFRSVPQFTACGNNVEHVRTTTVT